MVQQELSEKYILDLVRFEDVLIKYNKSYNITVNFIFHDELKGSTFDWIGIFQAGWNRFESFLAYEWGIGKSVDDTGRKRRIVFSSQYLKDAVPNTSYQFVYISKHLEILGVSQFFQIIDGSDEYESICLNASFISPDNVHNSAEYQMNRGEYIEFLKKNTSAFKKPQPTCTLNLPNNWEQIYTSCWRCKSLFELKNKHNALISELKTCSEQNEVLQERLNRLEITLQNAYIPKTLIEPWDENNERLKFQQFWTSMAKLPKIEKHVYNKDLYAQFNDNESSSRELLLKSIIKNQEEKIGELTRTVSQMQCTMIPNLSPFSNHTDVITLVKTRERMIPEIVDLKNSEEEDFDENDNVPVQENKNFVQKEDCGGQVC